jgi:hypothetical protein
MSDTTLIPTPAAVRGSAPAAAQAGQASPEVFGPLINLAGRQRMLSQRIVLYAMLSAQGDASSLTTAGEALELFRGSHLKLLRSRENMPPAAASALQEAFFGAQGADAPIREFMRLAEDTLTAVAAGGAAARRLLPSLVARATPTLGLLNTLTQTFETLGRQQAVLEQQHRAALIAQIQRIASEARIVSLNARVIAARSGTDGREFAVVAGVLSGISEQIERLSQAAMASG